MKPRLQFWLRGLLIVVMILAFAFVAMTVTFAIIADKGSHPKEYPRLEGSPAARPQVTSDAD